MTDTYRLMRLFNVIIKKKREVLYIIDTKKGTDVYLFVEKLKPALLLGINHRFSEELQGLYKHIKVDDLRIIFYHEDITLDIWEKETHKKKDFAQAIGIVLGFPPNAVGIYGTDKELSKGAKIKNAVYVDYHGQAFVTNKEYLKEDLQYLLDNMPIPLDKRTFIEVSTKSEPNGSFDIVKRINVKQ